MKNSASTSRTSLLAKSRQHFVVVAASSILLTGALTAYVAQDDSSKPAGAGTGSDAMTAGCTDPSATGWNDDESNDDESNGIESNGIESNGIVESPDCSNPNSSNSSSDGGSNAS